MARDKIDAGVIDPRAFVSVLGQRVQQEGFREVAGDFGMTGAFLHGIQVAAAV